MGGIRFGFRPLRLEGWGVGAVEIQNVGFEKELPARLERCLLSAQIVPEESLCLSHRLSESACLLGLFRSAVQVFYR